MKIYIVVENYYSLDAQGNCGECETAYFSKPELAQEYIDNHHNYEIEIKSPGEPVYKTMRLKIREEDLDVRK